MRCDPQKHQRRSIRLPGYDYAQAGAYFVTICTWHRVCLFGDVVTGEIVLNGNGRIAHHQWMRLGRRFTWADFSTFIIMPNHMHGIVVIRESGRGAGEDFQSNNTEDSPLRPYASGPQVAAGSLGALVRAYKSSVTGRINALRGCANPPVWQRNYYEHIIRDEVDLQQIAEYIQANPGRWAEDELNPGDAVRGDGD